MNIECLNESDLELIREEWGKFEDMAVKYMCWLCTALVLKEMVKNNKESEEDGK